VLLSDLLAHNARVRAAATVLSGEGGEVSHAELRDTACRLASELYALGARKGDRVAVLTRDSRKYLEMLFAVARIGAVLVPLNPLLIAREHGTLLRDSKSRFLLYSREFEALVGELRPGLPDETAFLGMDGSGSARPVPAETPRQGPPPPLPAGLSDRDVVLQVYTAGSGGRPKGAMLTHRNLLSACASAAVELGLSRRDVFLSCAPLPFLAGTGRLLRFLYVGGQVVLLEDFDPESALRTIERRKITHALFTPSMMARILTAPAAERYNLSTLRMVLYGGGFIPLDLLKRAIRFFRCSMVQAHGMVESSGVLTFLHPEDHALEEDVPYMRRLISVGKEAVGVEVRVVDGTGAEVAPDQVGEVVARGENIFQGYYGDPGFTAEVLRNGWLYTGDVASVDEEGYVYLVDRKRDELTVEGIPVDPREIENVLAEHAAIAEAAVVGRPDYALGEVPVAIVSLRQGATADREKILAHCRRNLAPFKVPRAIELLPGLPKNSAGKVLKAKLRERMLARPPYSPNTSAVKE
jgi:long-chain acyl-CoA synthetase